jgi:glycosyltransferase involved in cell wall biosynthesis
MSLDVAVIVCTYDAARWRDLEATMASLTAQSRRPAEVVLVVDHNPELLERARAGFPFARVVPNTGRGGLGEGRNTGIANSSSPIVAFIDDDATASPGWLAALADAYTDPEVAGVGGPIEPLWTGARPPWFPPEFDWVVGCTYRGMAGTQRNVRNLLGCNMSLRRSLVADLEGFRVGYGCDETDLCIRLHQQWPSKRLVFAQDATVGHRITADRQRFRYFVSRCYFEGGSKAVVATLVGSSDALSSERHYTRTVLPAAVRRGVRESLTRRNWQGLATSAAVAVGLASTAAGYLIGRLTTARAARRRGWYAEESPAAYRRRAAATSASPPTAARGGAR